MMRTETIPEEGKQGGDYEKPAESRNKRSKYPLAAGAIQLLLPSSQKGARGA